MAIKPIVLQRQLTEVGRIRIGQVVEGTKRNGDTYTRPDKLDTFRFTSISRPLIEKIAAEYGGDIAPWTPANGGGSGWEVVSSTARIPVLVPPQDVGERQYLEQWSGGRCTRRCDGEIELLTNQACICIATDDMRCKPKTRLSVMLRDIEGLGTWRIESNGWGTASTLPGTAQFLMQHGGYVSATLYLQPRSRVAEVNGKPQTQNWMVPALEVEGITPGQLNGGANGGGSAAVGRGQQRAVEEQQSPAIAAPELPDFVALIKDAGTREAVIRIWEMAKTTNAPGPAIEAAAKARVAELAAQQQDQTAPAGPEVHIAAAQAATTMGQLTTALRMAQLAGFGKDINDTADPVAVAFKEQHLALASAEAGTASPPPPPAPQTVAPAPQQEREALWSQIVSASSPTFDRLPDLEQDFASKHGCLPNTATAEQLATYLAELTSGTRTQTPANDDSGVPF